MPRRLSMLVLAGIIYVGSFPMSARVQALDPSDIAFEKLPVRTEWPDNLTMFDGRKVTTWHAWETERKPELKELFQQLMYGRYPSVKPQIQATIVHENTNAFDGKATLREVALEVVPGSPKVYWLVVLPKQASPTARVPMFVGLNFYGNHELTDDPKVRVPEGWMYPRGHGVVNNRASEAGRNQQVDTWPIPKILEQGYGLAVAYNGEIRPDDPKVRGGLADLLLPEANQNDPTATATIMAWAWGLLRGVDYVLTLPEVDPAKIAVVGHSRLGKTAMLAGAFDDRISITIANQAGCGGTSPNRRTNPKGEPVSRINTAFPHWFNGNFKKFNEATDRLPFDQHALVALCAPRAVLFTTATEDQWADPPGQFRVLQQADSVYQLANVVGFPVKEFPADNQLVGGKLGFWNRPGKHAMTSTDWNAYLEFAKRQWAD